MGQFLQTNGDYGIKTAEGGLIKLDVGPPISGGAVRITGNLFVEGDVLTVEARDLNIEDNLIILNYGEKGPGVSLRYSGIHVDRGGLNEEIDPSEITLPTVLNSGAEGPAAIVYDEQDNTWLFAHGNVDSGWNYFASKVRLKEILTSTTADLGDLTLIGVAGTSVVKVRSDVTDDGTQYRDNVSGPNDIPNKKYVDDAIQNNPTFQIRALDTRVIIADKEVTPNDTITGGSIAYFNNQTTKTTYGESAISMLVDGELTAQFYTNRFEVGLLEIGGGAERNEITTVNGITNQDILIRTQGTGRLQTNTSIEMEQLANAPHYALNASIIYAADASIGQTGLWFVNDESELYKRNGELISKNRALLFSMIF